MRGHLHRGYSQSSIELIITLSFGLAILLPIITLAFMQVSNSNSALSAGVAQASAERLAAVASQVAVQGYPARQTVVLEVPQGVNAIYIGALSYNGIGNEVTFVLNTQAGLDYITAFTPVNVSGYLPGIHGPASYIVNVTAAKVCPANSGIGLPCAFVKLSS